MKKILLLTLTLLSLSIATFSAFAVQPVKDLLDVAVPINADGTAISLENVKTAIITKMREKPLTSGGG
jgi:hypothetical protein